jgi:BlaI family transcriptional regulator, penicillinase repressor
MEFMMTRQFADLPDAELAVLRALWDLGPATIRNLTDALYPDGTEAHYATVQKLLDRLEAKQCVVRDRSALAHRFQAVLGRNELIGHRLEAMAEKLCGGSLTPLLTNLVRSKRLSARERREIRKLMEELDS